MHLRRFILPALSLAVWLGTSPTAWPQSQPRPKVQTGPEVGAAVPPFEASDQSGAQQNFETLRGPKGLLLLFYRSADW